MFSPLRTFATPHRTTTGQGVYNSSMNSESDTDRQELAKRYADLTDFQLERVAKVAYSLRESAKAALSAEILSRKLDVALVEAVPDGPDDVRLIVVRQFLDIPSALLAKKRAGLGRD
jgi:hypothetical protein